MNKIKKSGYISIITIFIITAITYVLGVIYITGEYMLWTRLLPEPIWDLLDIYFYKEAGSLRLAMTVVIFMILSLLLTIFYRKDISKITTVLHILIPIITIFWWFSEYWLSSVVGDGVTVGKACTVISVICIVNTIATAILLIRDRNKIEI